MAKKPSQEPGLTVAEAGRRGGEAVKAKYGAEFYEAIGRKGGLKTKETHGPEFFEAIGRKGGRLGGRNRS